MLQVTSGVLKLPQEKKIMENVVQDVLDFIDESGQRYLFTCQIKIIAVPNS
jgi:hypothetical protein